MRILGVLHPGGGRSGLLAERAAATGDELVEWVPARGEPLPAPLGAFGALVVFGGGMNVRDAERMPWMTGEIELLRDAVQQRVPTLGVCLGGQLLAVAAGAEVRRASEPEIGFFDVARTQEDPVLGALPERFEAYQWHSYTFDLPAGAVELARSPVCSQAFRLHDRAWGVQFHPEVTPEIVRDWALDFESDPGRGRAWASTRPRTSRGSSAACPAWMELGRRLFDGFLATARAAAAPAAPAARSAPALPRPRG